jgi:Uma2 family endonuclease
MSSTAEDLIHRHRYTVEDYYRMAEVGILAPDARVELLEGEVIEMPPIGAPHAAVVTDLQTLLIGAVGGDAIVRVQNPVRLGLHDEPQPDIALVKPPASKYRHRHPAAPDVLLLIEVVDTSLRYDREVKLPLYAGKGIPETWLLDLVRRELTRYRRPSATGYTDWELLGNLVAVPVPGLDAICLDLSVVV